jgi:hypothetical protein
MGMSEHNRWDFHCEHYVGHNHVPPLVDVYEQRCIICNPYTEEEADALVVPFKSDGSFGLPTEGELVISRLPSPECPQTRFPDGTHCGEYGWHAKGCPLWTKAETENCAHCKDRIQYGWPTAGEWAHTHGGRWCRDSRGFTATPLSHATPLYHGPGDVL